MIVPIVKTVFSIQYFLLETIACEEVVYFPSNRFTLARIVSNSPAIVVGYYLVLNVNSWIYRKLKSKLKKQQQPPILLRGIWSL